MSGKRAWSIDISPLTGADVGDVMAADRGDVEATQRLLEKCAQPGIEALPLTDWEAAREALIDAILGAMFPRAE